MMTLLLVPDAVQRAMLLRSAGTHRRQMWTPDQQRTTPQERRVAQHPGNGQVLREYLFKMHQA
jgi:hypothetical protein